MVVPSSWRRLIPGWPIPSVMIKLPGFPDHPVQGLYISRRGKPGASPALAGKEGRKRRLPWREKTHLRAILTMSPWLTSPRSLGCRWWQCRLGPVPRFHLAHPLIPINSPYYGLKYSYRFFPWSQAEYLWVWMCHGESLLTPTAALKKLSLR